MPKEKAQSFTGGAVGAGVVLVMLPMLALVFGMGQIDKYPQVGLPLLAIVGIMILFGAMALTSTLFARLGLANREEALALPAGSVRAAIALALIVLFAIIAIMLFQSLAEPYRINGLSEGDMKTILQEPRNRVLAVRRMECANGLAVAGAVGVPGASASAPACFDVHLVQPAGQEAIDIAKQLLILIGTLMTSVTSYYFAARTAAAPNINKAATGDPEQAKPTPLPEGPAAAALARGAARGEAEDGCDVEIVDPTRDEELPAAQGGVA